MERCVSAPESHDDSGPGGGTIVFCTAEQKSNRYFCRRRRGARADRRAVDQRSICRDVAHGRAKLGAEL
jgi:hypothetical protein